VNIPAEQGVERTFKVIDLCLTKEQLDEISPLVHKAARDQQNIFFIATAVPFWSAEQGETVWHFQVAALPARAAYKIAKLIRQAIEP